MSNLELETVPFAKAGNPKPALLHLVLLQRLQLARPGEAVRIREQGTPLDVLRKRIDCG